MHCTLTINQKDECTYIGLSLQIPIFIYFSSALSLPVSFINPYKISNAFETNFNDCAHMRCSTKVIIINLLIYTQQITQLDFQLKQFLPDNDSIQTQQKPSSNSVEPQTIERRQQTDENVNFNLARNYGGLAITSGLEHFITSTFEQRYHTLNDLPF